MSKNEREIHRDVYVNEFLVAEVSSPDIVDFIENGICPFCRTESIYEETEGDVDMAVFTCDGCGIAITIEEWEEK